MLAPITATGLPYSFASGPYGREPQSTKCLSWPGSAVLNSGVAISRASASSIFVEEPVDAFRMIVFAILVVGGERLQVVVDLHLDVLGCVLGRSPQQARVVREPAQAAGDCKDLGQLRLP